MTVGIIYATHFGYCTEAAQKLQEKLSAPSEIIKFDYKGRYDLSQYEALILGGSIRMGLLDQDFIGWLNSHKDDILAKPFAFFIACGFPDDLPKYVSNCVPQELRDHALALANIGGKLDGTYKLYDKILVGMMVKQLRKEGKDLPSPHLENLDEIVRVIDGAVRNIPQDSAEQEG